MNAVSPVIQHIVTLHQAREEVLLQCLVRNLHARRVIEQEIIEICDPHRAAELLIEAEEIFREEVG